MGSRQRRALVTMGGRRLTAWQKTALSYNPLALWPLDDALGSAYARELVANRLGVYNGCTLAGDTFGVERAITMNGTSDTVAIDALIGSFPLAEGTLCGWSKTTDWATVDQRTLVGILWEAAQWIQPRKELNKVTLYRRATPGTNDHIGSYATTTTAWFHWAVTWSVVGSAVQQYINANLTTLTTDTQPVIVFDGQPTDCDIGSVGGVRFWLGSMANVVLYPTPLALSAIQALAVYPT